MPEQKPLHVQVAEALGIEVSEVGGVWYADAEIDAADDRHDGFSAKSIPHYDTDWSATGPLIEKYRIALRPTRSTNQCVDQLDRLSWDAFIPSGTDRLPAGSNEFNVGVTPLIAVCCLIIELAKAGKL